MSKEIKNKLYLGDCLDVLKSLPANSIDLVATDPPWNRKKIFWSLHKSSGNIALYDDTWRKGETGYINMLTDVIVEIHRVLKDTGSIYLHSDPSIDYKIRPILDKIFGKRNFLNQLVWLYKTGGTSKSFFSRKHDTIMLYVKDRKKYVFNFRKEKSYLAHKYGFSNIEIKEDDGGYYTEVGIRDVWNISALRGNHPEYVGSPSQKPIELYKRMILASTNPEDVVMDPFMGSGTTCVAAAKSNRKFIGVDTGRTQLKITEGRLQGKDGDTGLTYIEGIDYEIVTKFEDTSPVLFEDKRVHDLYNECEKITDDFEYEVKMVQLRGGVPSKTTKGPDGGVDGRRTGEDRAIIAVKKFKGRAGPDEVRKYSSVTVREDYPKLELITRGGFTNGAYKSAAILDKKHGIEIVLLDQNDVCVEYVKNQKSGKKRTKLLLLERSGDTVRARVNYKNGEKVVNYSWSVKDEEAFSWDNEPDIKIKKDKKGIQSFNSLGLNTKGKYLVLCEVTVVKDKVPATSQSQIKIRIEN